MVCFVNFNKILIRYLSTRHKKKILLFYLNIIFSYLFIQTLACGYIKLQHKCSQILNGTKMTKSEHSAYVSANPVKPQPSA